MSSSTTVYNIFFQIQSKMKWVSNIEKYTKNSQLKTLIKLNVLLNVCCAMFRLKLFIRPYNKLLPHFKFLT